MCLWLVGEYGPGVQDGHQSSITHGAESSDRDKEQYGGI